MLDLLAFARFSLSYLCQLLFKLIDLRRLKRVLVQH